MMDNPIDDCCCYYLVGENLPPFVKIVIAGDNNTTLLIAHGDQTEKKISLLFADGHITKLVYDHKVKARITQKLVCQAAVF
jgi:hypothetical protein